MEQYTAIAGKTETGNNDVIDMKQDDVTSDMLRQQLLVILQLPVTTANTDVTSTSMTTTNTNTSQQG